MAITQCSECGGKVSTRATVCPHCGCPVEPQITCPDCGEEMAASLVACPVCGGPIAVPETPEKPSEPPAPVAAPLPVAASDSTRLERSAPVIESVAIPKTDFRTLYFSLKGRITRKTYWLRFVLPIFVIYVVGFRLDLFLGINWEGGVGIGGPVASIIGLLMLWPATSGFVKRLHNRGMSGKHAVPYWGLLLSAVFFRPAVFQLGPEIREVVADAGIFLFLSYAEIPWLVYWLYLFVVTGFLEGTEGPNRYGPDPLRGSAK
jgi:uncharacterized membrane protein YhaH (DUF805 family)